MQVDLLKSNYIEFTSRLPKGVFYDVRDIPNLRCAKCGHKMLSPSQVDEFLYPNSEYSGLEIVLKKLESYSEKYPEEVEFIKNLFKHKKEKRLPVILSRPQVKLKIEELKRTTRLRTKKIIGRLLNDVSIQRSLLTPKDSERSLKKILKIKSELPQTHQQLLDLLIEYKKAFPAKSLVEIVQNPLLVEYHNQFIAAKHLKHASKLEKSMKQSARICKRLPKEQGNKFHNICMQANRIAKNHQISLKLKKEIISDLFERFKLETEDKNLVKSISKYISEIPIYNVNEHDIFYRLNRHNYKTDAEIINYIILPLRNTFEHVIPRSSDGKNYAGNGIFLCKNCNEERATHPYPLLMRVFPEFIVNMQKQISRISSFINSGQLKGYDDYPKRIKKTIKTVSGQDISIKTFLKNEKNKVSKKIQANSEKLAEIYEKREDIKIKMSELKKQSDNLGVEFYDTQSEYMRNVKHLENINKEIKKDKK